MTTAVEASAPGKLFLIGEYAVLDGAPALLTAVDRRVHVRVESARDGRWSLTAPNLGIDALDLGAVASERPVFAADIEHKLAVFDAVRQEAETASGAPLDATHVMIDSADFARDGHKLGLGSSAAVAAALYAALTHAAGLSLTRPALAEGAIRAHRRAQNGAGSGGDVATAVYGGLISYTRDTDPVALKWPRDLVALAVITGTGASTPDLVGRVRDYAAREPDTHARDIARLAELAETAARALAETSDFLDLAAAYFAALCRLDDHAQAGIVCTQHHALADLVANAGGVFKTSGAGGGDVGLVFVARGPNEQAVRQALAATDAQIVDLSFGAAGVRIDNAGTMAATQVR
ncbi:phosphomevalonate kinase [Salinisphaera dokdonensis CL-ES53]|uniref:Phosphomevalonate kinase n=1 Tax=Salinisphaera dokdonensis CL-ES53 TaxID=1304272 RepID=A0ABV2AXU0_9GAMM